MQKIALLLIDLLAHLTLEPEEGHDPDASADLQIDTWQTLIHDLSPEEKEVMKTAAKQAIKAIVSQPNPHPDKVQLANLLDAYVHDELQ